MKLLVNKVPLLETHHTTAGTVVVRTADGKTLETFHHEPWRATDYIEFAVKVLEQLNPQKVFLLVDDDVDLDLL